MKPTYDPIEFISKIEIITLAIIGSFITMKFLNAMYENIYEPMVDVLIDSDKSEKYYIKCGNYYINIDTIIKEIIKWILLIVILMIVYNLIAHRRKK